MNPIVYRVVPLLALVLIISPAAGQTTQSAAVPNGAPFHLGADILPGSALDVSFLLHRPAGSRGGVRADGERLAFGDGSPAAFWGVNLCWDAIYPPETEAANVARRLAMSGCNLVRLTYWDGGKNGIFRQDRDDTHTADADRLARLDRFAAELKDHGVYTLLVLGMGRTSLKAGDGADAYDDADVATADYQIGRFFDERIRRADQRVWRTLLEHVNPHTGQRWADDPSVATIEIVNEASLFYRSNKLKDMPPALKEKVGKRWNEWLAKRHATRRDLVRAWGDAAVAAHEDPARGTVELDFDLLQNDPGSRKGKRDPRESRAADWNRFLAEACRAYHQEQVAFLRSLGVKQPISCNGGASFGAADRWSNVDGEVFDAHVYHDHPNWSPEMTYTNRSLLKSGLTLVQNLARGQMAGQVYGVSEYDFCFPNDWRAEGWVPTAAYARFHGWSQLTAFAYWAGSWEDRASLYAPGSGIRSVWRIHNDPAAFGQWPVTALIFLRGDVAPARRTIDVGYSETDTFAAERARFSPDFLGFMGDAPLVHRVRRSHFDDAYAGDADLVVASGRSTSGYYRKAKRAILGSGNPAGDVYGLKQGAFVAADNAVVLPADEVAGDAQWFEKAVARLPDRGDLLPEPADGWVTSDTGELRYRRDPGVFVIDTPRTQGVVGFAGGRRIATRDLEIAPETDFGSIVLSSLDNQPLAQSKRMLLTAVGRCQNADFQRRPDGENRFRADGASLGKGPIHIEPLRFTLTLDGGKDLKAFALDGTGRRVASMALANKKGEVRFTADGSPATIYYELVDE